MRLCQKLLRSVHLRQMFVPRSAPVRQPDVDQLQTFVNRSEKLMVLTGAGISTESGIPDYRSAGTGLYARTNQRPIQYKDFLQNASSRQRYWARNFVGWPRFSSVEPNRTHLTLSDWESKGKSFWLVTQNVDCLHYKAGSKRVTELHGSAHRCTCLSCNNIMKRWDLQKLFQQYNPDWTTEYITESIAPDGDVLLLDEQIKDFEVCSFACLVHLLWYVIYACMAYTVMYSIFFRFHPVRTVEVYSNLTLFSLVTMSRSQWSTLSSRC